MKKKSAMLSMAAVLFFTMSCLAETRTQELYRACVNGDVQSVKMMYPIMKPGELDQEIRPGYWPLYCAVENGHFELVKFLVQHGADYAKKTNCGQSLVRLALSKAVDTKVRLRNVYFRIAQWLLKQGKVPPASPRNIARPPLLRSFSDRRA